MFFHISHTQNSFSLSLDWNNNTKAKKKYFAAFLQGITLTIFSSTFQKNHRLKNFFFFSFYNFRNFMKTYKWEYFKSKKSVVSERRDPSITTLTWSIFWIKLFWWTGVKISLIKSLQNIQIELINKFQRHKGKNISKLDNLLTLLALLFRQYLNQI